MLLDQGGSNLFCGAKFVFDQPLFLTSTISAYHFIKMKMLELPRVESSPSEWVLAFWTKMTTMHYV